MGGYCFVIQPYDGADFDNRFEDIIKPAIEACDLMAYRVDEDPYVEVAISAIEEKIREATLVVAEISKDNPNVWFELGYAFALEKNVIMLCDGEYRKGTLPFDISHHNVLMYRSGSMRDFLLCIEKLKIRISAKLKKIRLLEQKIEMTQEERLILKILSRDQKTAEAMTPEEKIIKSDMSEEQIADCLKSLTNKKCVEYRYSTSSGKGFYQLTAAGNKILEENVLCQY